MSDDLPGSDGDDGAPPTAAVPDRAGATEHQAGPERPSPADDGGSEPSKEHSSATVALILGIASLFLFGVVLGALAVYLGSKAEREIAGSGGRLTGANRARWGKNLGIAGIVIWAIVLLASVLL